MFTNITCSVFSNIPYSVFTNKTYFQVLVSKISSTKCDIWSLAVVLLCILNKGHLVNESSTYAGIIKILFGGQLSVREKCSQLSVQLQDQFVEVCTIGISLLIHVFD